MNLMQIRTENHLKNHRVVARAVSAEKSRISVLTNRPIYSSNRTLDRKRSDLDVASSEAQEPPESTVSGNTVPINI